MRYLPATLLLGVALVFTYLCGVFCAAGFNFGYEPHPRSFAAALVPWALALLLGWAALRSLGASSPGRIFAAGCAIPIVGLIAVVGYVELTAPSAAEATRRDTPLLAAVKPFPGSTPLGQEAVAIPPDPESGEEGFLNSTQGYELVRTERLPAGTSLDQAERYYSTALEQAHFRPRSFPDTFNNGVHSMDVIGRDGDALIYVTIDPEDSRLEADLMADYKGNSS